MRFVVHWNLSKSMAAFYQVLRILRISVKLIIKFQPKKFRKVVGLEEMGNKRFVDFIILKKIENL